VELVLKEELIMQQITAPLPGRILSLKVKVGDEVKKDDIVFVMEALKMSNNILAEADGVVKAIHVKDGDDVETDDPVMDIE
jgi:biotin carboxyl carrier protein